VAVGLFSGGIISSLLLGYTIFSAGLFVPVLAGLTRRPLRRRAAIAATLGGGGIALTGKLLSAEAIIAAGFLFTLLLWIADRILLHRHSRGR
jgi:hypothetical protein